MKVLSIGTDRNLFKEGSEVRQRVVEYGGLVDELHIIVLSRRRFEKQNFSNVFLYPTNSLSKFNYIFDAVKIGKEIIEDWKLKIGNSADKFIVSSQDPFECGYVGYRISNKFKIPLQLQIHTDFLSPYFGKESLLNKIRVHMAKFLIPKASGIRVVSERVKDSILRRLNLLAEVQPPITVLPIFVDVEKIKNSPIQTDLHKKYPGFDFIILMASRLTKEKNIKMAISVVSDIVSKYPKAGLVIVGSGPEREALKLQVTSYKLQKNIIFEPWTDDLASYYKTADLFLLISNYEGYGRTVIEAMAAGCPIVMTDVGLAGDIVKNGFNGFVIPVKDGQKLFENLRLLITSPGRLKNLVFAAEQTLRDFPTKKEYLEKYKQSWISCFG